MENSWKDTTSAEAQAFSQGQFQGMTVQALQDIRNDIQEIKQDSRIKMYIHYAVTVFASAIGMLIGKKIL